MPNKKSIDRLINRIKSCIDYQSIYSMEDGFNSVGLTIQSTAKNRMILCKLVDNIPKAEEAGIDYIFIGGLDISTNEISERVEQKIIDFVLNNAGEEQTVKGVQRLWKNGLKMYESTIVLESEDVQYIATIMG